MASKSVQTRAYRTGYHKASTRHEITALVWMVAVASLVFLILAVSTKPTLAQSATCRSLQAQLAQIETGRGAAPSQQFIRYDRAVRDQQVQIAKTERAARKNSCQYRNSNRCNRIMDSLGKMYANLNALERTRAKFAPSGGTSADRAMIIRSMRQNRCGAEAIEEVRAEPQQDRRRSLLEQIFGSKTYSSNGFEEDPNSRSRVQGSGTFRTLCVRTCDGYYFPISFSTTKNHFEDDLNKCQQMCPGTETALFYHTMPGGDAETSISYRTGEPYSSLTNAFSYRTKVNNQCGCRAATSIFEEVAGSTEKPQTEVSQAPEPRIAIPTSRLDVSLSEETLQSIEGDMTVDKLASIASGGGGNNSRGNGDIRIVGPAFFPVQ